MKRSGPLKRKIRLTSNAARLRDQERRKLVSRLGDVDHDTVARNRLATAARKESEWQEARSSVIFRSRGLCEANWPGVCKPGAHAGQHVHHIKLRSQGGDHSVDNLLHVCVIVHRHAHDVDRAGAEERGIIARHTWVEPR